MEASATSERRSCVGQQHGSDFLAAMGRGLICLGEGGASAGFGDSVSLNAELSVADMGEPALLGGPGMQGLPERGAGARGRRPG